MLAGQPTAYGSRVNSFMRDFRGFALSGNVVDLAIGVFCTGDLEPAVSERPSR
jgi:hypothetical protein